MLKHVKLDCQFGPFRSCTYSSRIGVLYCDNCLVMREAG